MDKKLIEALEIIKDIDLTTNREEWENNVKSDFEKKEFLRDLIIIHEIMDNYILHFIMNPGEPGRFYIYCPGETICLKEILEKIRYFFELHKEVEKENE